MGFRVSLRHGTDCLSSLQTSGSGPGQTVAATINEWFVRKREEKMESIAALGRATPKRLPNNGFNVPFFIR